MNLSPSSSQWTRWLDSGWTPHSLHYLPVNIDTTRPKPSVTHLWLIQHAFPKLQFLCYSWRKLNFCSLELASVYLFIWVERYRPKRIESRDSNRYLYNHFHSSIIHNSQQVESIQVPIKGWMGKQNVDTYTVEYYSALKRKETRTHDSIWMNPEDILLSEISQMRKDKYCDSTYIRHLE